MKKSVFLFMGILFFAAMANFNLSSKSKEVVAPDLTLQNIQLLQAHAQSEIGQSCWTGCQYTGSLSDYCVLCTTCTGQFLRKNLGYHEEC